MPELTERQADQRWVEDTRRVYEARANKGTTYRGVPVVYDETMQWTPETEAAWRRLNGMADPHASIVGPDGKVGAIDPSPVPWWANRGA